MLVIVTAEYEERTDLDTVLCSLISNGGEVVRRHDDSECSVHCRIACIGNALQIFREEFLTTPITVPGIYNKPRTDLKSLRNFGFFGIFF
jgi:hypothetical protein